MPLPSYARRGRADRKRGPAGLRAPLRRCGPERGGARGAGDGTRSTSCCETLERSCTLCLQGENKCPSSWLQCWLVWRQSGAAGQSIDVDTQTTDGGDRPPQQGEPPDWWLPLFNCIKKRASIASTAEVRDPGCVEGAGSAFGFPKNLRFLSSQAFLCLAWGLRWREPPAARGPWTKTSLHQGATIWAKTAGSSLACWLATGMGAGVPGPTDFQSQLSSAPQTFAMLDSPLSCCAAMQCWVISRDAPGPSECRRPARKLRRPALIARFAKNHAGNFQHVAWEWNPRTRSFLNSPAEPTCYLGDKTPLLNSAQHTVECGPRLLPDVCTLHHEPAVLSNGTGFHVNNAFCPGMTVNSLPYLSRFWGVVV